MNERGETITGYFTPYENKLIPGRWGVVGKKSERLSRSPLFENYEAALSDCRRLNEAFELGRKAFGRNDD